MSDFYNKYPYTDFHELNLDWVIERVKKLTEDWAATLEEWNSTEEQWHELYDYVHDYFDNLDVQQEINNKINAMIADGSFKAIAQPIIEAQTIITTTTWLAEHITQPTTPIVDTSLAILGAAADSKTVGDEFTNVHDLINDIDINLRIEKPVVLTASKGVEANHNNPYFGQLIDVDASISASDYISLANALEIWITSLQSDTSTELGIVFYDSSHVALEGFRYSNLNIANDLKHIKIDSSWKYMRTSVLSDQITYGEVKCFILYNESISEEVKTNSADITQMRGMIPVLYNDVSKSLYFTLHRRWQTDHTTGYSNKYMYSQSMITDKDCHVEFHSLTYIAQVFTWNQVGNSYNYVDASAKASDISFDIDSSTVNVYAVNFNRVDGTTMQASDVQAALSELLIFEYDNIPTLSLIPCIVDRSLLANTTETIISLKSDNSCYYITNLSSGSITFNEIIIYNSKTVILPYPVDPGRSINMFAPDKANQIILTATSTTDTNISVKIEKSDHTRPAHIEFRAHLGYQSIAPENTMSAFRYAALAGFKSIILSTKRTLDNIWVVCHNDTIDDTSDGSGAIASMTYSQLLQYDFGSWFDTAFTGEPIPTVDEVLQLCSKMGITPVIRFDWASGFEGIYELIQKNGLVGKAYMHQGNVTKLVGFYPTYGNNIKYSVFLSTIPSAADIAAVASLNDPIIEIERTAITAEAIADIYAANIKAGVYIANDLSEIRSLLDVGVSEFNTDNFALEGLDF